MERVVTFQAAVSPLGAVQQAVYRMSDRLSCDLTLGEGSIRCCLHFRPDISAVDDLVAEFRNQVLDETLRLRVREETREVRNLILALAFSNTGLVDSQDA